MTQRKKLFRKCPENCRYRSTLVRYCGYCLNSILNESEENKNADGENKDKHTE